MNELVIIREYADGSVLVGDPYGETQHMTKEEYETYCKNIEL